MNFFTSLVIFSIVVLHQADFELNILQTDDTAHAGNAKAKVTGSLPATQKQQHQTSKTLTNTRKITTLRPVVFQTKGLNKITDPVRQIPHPDANAVKASHQEEKRGSVTTDHSSNQNAPVLNTVGAHMHDNVDTPVSDIDRKVSTNVDNGDDTKHRNVKENNDNEHKIPHASQVRPVDQHSKPDTVLSEAKQLHSEPKIIAHDHQEKAEGPQQERSVLEIQQEQKVTVEEVKEQRTPTQELQLEKKTIPKVESMEQEITVSQEDNQVQQLSQETPMDDRMVGLSSTDQLDDTKQPIQPNTSIDPVTPEVSIESLQPVQDAGSSLNTGDSPTQHLETTTTDAAQALDSSGQPQQETPEDKFPNIEDSIDPSVILLNATTSETSSNESLPVTAKSDEEEKSTKSPDIQPSSVQPPSRSSEMSPDAVPSTAFVPGEVKSENDSDKSISELEVPTDMPSFDEWKQKEKEKSKHLEAEQTGQSPVPPVKVKGSKKRINYASVTCGAKVVGANQEAQNPSFMLIENKDQYMINPCKVKKVFTVELCESVQVQAIDIGNLELFSSLPQSFDVHVSDRFPSKEWKALGRFHARDERNIQTFQVEDSLIFAKYIKIEMLSHYGQEHYCPLSILRVFGTTVDEDDDNDDSESENPDLLDEENVTDSFSEDNPTNLFASATDTVLSLVKTVLNPSIDTSQRDHDAASLESSDNLSINSTGDGKKTMEPCTPEVIAGDANVVEDRENIVNGEAEPFQPLVPDALVKAIDQPQGDEENISTDDKSSMNKQFTITLIETPRTSIPEILDSCHFCDDGKNDSCLFDRDTMCGYYRLMSFVDPQSCLTAWRNLRPPEPKLTEEGSGVAGQLNMTWVPEPEVTESKHQEGTDGSTETVVSETKEAALLGKEETLGTEKATASATLESTTVATKNGSQRNDTERADAGADPSRGGGPDSSGTEQEQAVVPPAGSIPESASKDYHSADKTSGSCAETVSQEAEATVDVSGHNEASGQVHGQDNQPAQDQTAQNQMAPGHTVQSTSQEQPQIAQGQNKTPVQKPADQTTGKPLSEKDDLVTGQGSNLRVIYAEASSKPEATKDYELDGVPMDEITYQKLSSRGKESAFIKLKNRIKLLEVNLNLTNRYLEELSQRYKRQMEDMHSSLNKTITKLSNMAKTAEERDLKQQDHIASLETTVENLTTVVTSVERSIESMHRQLIERHLCLMLLEVVVFSGILIFCLNRRSVQVVESYQHTRTLRTQQLPPAPSLPQTNRSANLRRKSADSQPSRDQSVGLWNHQNEDSHSRNAVEEVKTHPPLSGAKTAAGNALSSASANDFSKKRKKKKLSHIRSLSPSTEMPNKFDSLPSHSPAGLIFGTSCKDTLRNDLVERDHLQSHCKRLSWDSSAYKPWKWNIFGSSQNDKSSVLSPISCGTTLKLGRSEIRDSNLSNELDNCKNGLTQSSGLAENRKNEIFLWSAIDTHNKFHMKKMVSRGRPVAE